MKDPPRSSIGSSHLAGHLGESETIALYTSSESEFGFATAFIRILCDSFGNVDVPLR
jgi:hypothetical protein